MQDFLVNVFIFWIYIFWKWNTFNGQQPTLVSDYILPILLNAWFFAALQNVFWFVVQFVSFCYLWSALSWYKGWNETNRSVANLTQNFIVLLITMRGTYVASMTCPPYQQIHIQEPSFHFVSFLSFSYLLIQSLSSFSWCKPSIVSFVNERGSDISLYIKLTAHYLNRKTIFLFHMLEPFHFLSVRLSTTISSLSHHQSISSVSHRQSFAPRTRGRSSTSCRKQDPQLKLHARCYTESGVSF